MGSYSATRWWSRWEVYNQVLLQFGDVMPFIRSHPELSPATTRKLQTLLADAQKNALLRIELAAVVDCGEKFVKATYDLEGDGALVFKCFQVVETLTAAIHTAYFPNLEAVARSLSRGATTAAQQLVTYGKSCVQPGQDYFLSKMSNELKCCCDAFKAAQLFVPHKLHEMQPTAADIDQLKSLPFLDNAHVLHNLKAELSSYLAAASSATASIDTLEWWASHHEALPHWSAAVQEVSLVQPSSAAVERVFSILKSSFGPQQDNSLQDYVQSSLMLQYNKH